jgi:beta-lactamase regulating signal transducer with metallopeptidase domain
MALWIVGAAAIAVSILAALGRSRSIAARCAPVRDAELDEVIVELCRKMGISARPGAVVADWACVPMLLRRSKGYVVVVPSDLLASARRENLRLALAHELAHIKRRDLAWNWLPAAAKAVFFVNPLVWVAGRELGIAQEMACDEMAARASGAGFARYGRLLLTMVRPRRSAEPTWAVAAVSAGASAEVMRRRLIELGHAQDRPAARLGGSVVALLVVCALVMPFQVVEAPRRETPRARGSSIRVEVSAPEPSPLLHPRFVKLVFRPHD